MTLEPDPVNNRTSHVVAVWSDITLIWGGLLVTNEGGVASDCDPAEVYCHQDGIWTLVTTRGEVPPVILSCIGEVVWDYFYVACGMAVDEECIEINRKTFCRNRKRGISGEDFLPKAEINRNKSVLAERASFCQKMVLSAKSGPFGSIFHAAVTSSFGRN